MPATKTGNRNLRAVKNKQTDETVYGEKEDGILIGNLTADPEMRFTGNGKAVANFSVAVNNRVQDDDGNWADAEPEFYRVTVWQNLAENAAETLQKGDRIVASGYYQDRTFTSKDDERVTVTEFTARELGASLLFRTARIQRTQRK